MSGFAAFAKRAAEEFGCRCTTILLHHEDDAERLYSSDPDFVAPTGRKRFADAPAMARMKAHAKPQRFDGAAEIAAMFREAEKLIGSGYLCLVNLPVIDTGGRLQGQVNLTLPEGRLTDADLATLAEEANALAPLLVLERAADRGRLSG